MALLEIRDLDLYYGDASVGGTTYQLLAQKIQSDLSKVGITAQLKPLDQASAQYNLAHAYFAAGQRDQAEEHLLASLEAAPGYRPAQKLLLEIKDAEKGQ